MHQLHIEVSASKGKEKNKLFGCGTFCKKKKKNDAIVMHMLSSA